MRGLTILLISTSPDHYRAALTLAMAQAALNARSRIFVQGAAVAAFAKPCPLREEALELGVVISLCQTGLADCHLTADQCDPRFDYNGPVSVLASLGDDRLLAV